MTISSTIRTAGPYTGTGAVYTYPFGFKVFQASDVLVLQTDTSNNITTLALTSQYTVSLNPDQDTNPGGSITLVAPIGPLPTGYQLMISSQVPEVQLTQILNNGGFYPSVITQALDYLTILIQQVQVALNNCIQLSIAVTGVSPILPPPVASDIIGWNSAGTALVNTSPVAVGAHTITGGVAGSGGNIALATITNVNIAAGTILNTNIAQNTVTGGSTGNIAQTTITDFNIAANAAIQASKLQFTQSGTGATAMTVQAMLALQPIYLEQFGGGTGVSDNGPALADALAALPAGGGVIRLGRGVYTFLTAVNETLAAGAGAYCLHGEGPGATICTFPNGTGITLNLQSERSSVHVHRIGFITSTANTGTCLTVNNSVAAGEFETSTFRDLTFRGTVDGTTCWATCVLINELSGTSWDNVTMLGGAAGVPAGNGIIFQGQTSLAGASIYHNIAKCIFNALNQGIEYASWAQGIDVTQSNFENSNYGIVCPSADSGNGQAQLLIDNNQFNCFNVAILVFGCSLVSITGNCILLFTTANGAGIILSGTSYANIVSNNIVQTSASANATYGVTLEGATSNVTVGLNNFSGMLNGIYIANTANTIIIDRNTYSGVTTKVQNAGSATSVAVYGDMATAITNLSVGASPFTHTAGISPEVHYINGGTVSLIEKGSVFCSQATNFQIQLKPYESYTVTYSSAPNISYEKW